MGRSFPPCYIQNKEFQIENWGGGGVGRRRNLLGLEVIFQL